MQIDKIRGHRMTDTESMICEMNESDRAFQKLMDALSEIDYLIQDDVIGNIPEHDKKMGDRFYQMVVKPLKETLNNGDV